MKLNLIKISMVLILFMTYSCQNEPIENSQISFKENNSNQLEINLKVNEFDFYLKSSNKAGILTSELIIKTDKNNQIKIKQNIDTNVPAYKLAVHKNIIEKANLLKKGLTITSLDNLIYSFQEFGQKILFNENIKSNIIIKESIFYHNAILNTVKRSIEKNQDCECLPHPGYFVDAKPFWCQEDYLVNVDIFLNLLKNNKSEDLIKKEQIILMLENYNSDEIPFNKISSFLESKEDYLNRIENSIVNYQTARNSNTNRTEEDCTLGTDLGCCGNYSGCCWYWSYYCLDHDLACLACDKWHCGPACEPEEWVQQ